MTPLHKRLHKLNQILHKHHFHFCEKCISKIIRILWTCEIHPEAVMGENLSLQHSGFGIIIGPLARIGNNVQIMQYVTIGGNGPEYGMPIIEDNCLIGAGALVLGPITVGEGSVIGANSVVIRDVPPQSLVVGVPARVIKSNIDQTKYYLT